MTTRIGSLTLVVVVALGSAALAQAPVAPPPTLPARTKPAPKPTPPAVFEGFVLGPDAKPVVEAVIVLSSPADFLDPPIVARTDADGRFRVQARRRGPQTVRVEARGLAAQTIERAMPGAPLRVTLAKGGSIDGVARDAASGQPVAGARIEARQEGRPASPPWEPDIGVVAAQTDAKGIFKLEGLARGRHTVTASSRTAGRATQSGVALGQRLELLLVDGPSISGRVLTPDGKPAAGAAVRTEPETGYAQMRLVGADAAGRFDIAGLSPGAYRLIAHHKDWAVGIMAGVRADRGVDVEVDVVLAPPARVTGRLVDSNEQPLPGTVSLQEIDGQSSPRSLGALVRAEAGADGRFALERVPPGSHALAVGGRGVASRRVEVEVGARQKAVDIGDVVLEAGAQIRGRVRDKAGAPIADALVHGFPDGMTAGAMPVEGRTEADGRFVLGGASAPAYRLSVQAAGFAPLNHPVDAPSEGVELVLEAAGSIVGFVVDDAGRPVEAFEVSAMPGGPDAMRRGLRARPVVSEGGRFTLDDMAGGTYVVQVAARDLGRQVVSDVKVVAGAVTDVGRIRLTSAGAVRGTVLDTSGAPVVGATVEARGPDRPGLMRSDFQQETTDAGGGFHLRGLPTGTMVVIARHPEFAEGRSAPVDIEPSKTAEAAVVLTRGGRIEGVVRRRGGAAPPDLWVLVHRRSSAQSFSPPPGATPGADGSFVIDHVPPGRVGVSLMTRSGPGGGRGTGVFKEVDVREGETARVEFVWREILLTGKVTQRGAPLPNVRLTASGATSGVFFDGSAGVPAPSSGPQRNTAVTREDGSYEMIVGEPGSMTMGAEATVGKKAYPMRTIEVADVESQTVDLDFPAGGISGIVVDEESGAPIARASVAAMPAKPRPGGPGGGSATTGNDGRFSIDVDPGAFRLRVSAEDHATQTIEVTVGESPIGDVRIALSRGTGLRGRVVDSRGRPAPGVWLIAREEADEVMSASANSSLDGAFEFSSLRAGSYSLAGGSALSGFGTLTGISPGAADVVLRLSPGGRLRVSATEGNETPVDGAFVSIRRLNGVRFSFPGAGGRTGDDGTAEMDSPAGAIDVEVRKGALTGRGQATVTSGGLAILEVTLTEEAPPPAP